MLAVLPVTAIAAVGGGGTNTTTYTTSTKNTYDTSYASATNQVNNFSVELIAEMQGGTTLYDQTFNVAFADPTVQAAIIAAEAVLSANGAASFVGPTLLTTYTSLVGSVSQTGAPVVTSVDSTPTTTSYIGPQTIMTGNDQLVPFTIPPGGINFDTLITSIIHQLITTTTTNTYLTSAVYEIDGIAAPPTATVPEPGTLLLIGAGLIPLAIAGRKKYVK